MDTHLREYEGLEEQEAQTCFFPYAFPSWSLGTSTAIELPCAWQRNQAVVWWVGKAFFRHNEKHKHRLVSQTCKIRKRNNNDRHISETTTLVSHRFRETVYALCGEKNLSLGYFYFDYEREVTEKNGTIALTEGLLFLCYLSFFCDKKRKSNAKEKTHLTTKIELIFETTF